jgi:hypothetical protein
MCHNPIINALLQNRAAQEVNLSVHSKFLILTDKEGFFLSRDQGNSWEDFNHGESALLNGSQLRPVVTGSQDGIYVLYIDPAGESFNDGSNQLFRYARRSWPQRLRAGLISLLQASP